MIKHNCVIYRKISDIQHVSTSHGVGEKRVIAIKDDVGRPITQIAKTILREGECVEEHIHPTMSEHFFILDGSCTVTVDKIDYICYSGDYLFLPAGVFHSIKVHLDTTMITIGIESI